MRRSSSATTCSASSARPSVTGKPSGDDLREGKRTLLVARAFSKADPAQREVLAENFGQPDVDAAGIAAVQDVLRDTGALAAVETVIAELTTARAGGPRARTDRRPRGPRGLLALTDRAPRARPAPRDRALPQ